MRKLVYHVRPVLPDSLMNQPNASRGLIRVFYPVRLLAEWIVMILPPHR